MTVTRLSDDLAPPGRPETIPFCQLVVVQRGTVPGTSMPPTKRFFPQQDAGQPLVAAACGGDRLLDDDMEMHEIVAQGELVRIGSGYRVHSLPPPHRAAQGGYTDADDACATGCDALAPYRVPLAVLGLIGLILTLVLVPLSFQYVSINEWAFKKDTKTNSVDLGAVHSTGQYSWGVGFTTVAFPSTLLTVNMATPATDLDVFTDSGQTVSIGVVFRYRLDRQRLAQMYVNLTLNYHQRVLAVAKSAMRNAVTNYSVGDYTSQRENISHTLYGAVAAELGKVALVHVDRRHFALQYVLLPDVVMAQRVSIFEKVQVQETNGFTYQASLYRLATAQLVQKVQNDATLVRSQATLLAERMVAQANARAFQDVETESGRQLAAMAAALGVSANRTAELVLLNNMIDGQGEGNMTLLSGVTSALLKA